MTIAAIEEEILRIIKDDLGFVEATPESKLKSVTGVITSKQSRETPGTITLDELDSIELILLAEEIFNLEIPDEKVNSLISVKDFANYIDNLVKSRVS